MNGIKQTLPASQPRRHSGLELLKIFAILLIVISHTVQTMQQGGSLVEFRDYVLPLENASTELQYFILRCMRHFGIIGNNIFFVCTAWFLLDSEKVKKRKCLFLLLEVWFISVIIFIVAMALQRGHLPKWVIYQSFLPTTFENNWYVSCYIAFYCIHGLLNMVLARLSRRSHLLFALSAIILYFGIGFLGSAAWYYQTPLTLWIVIYFIMAYLKRYCPDFMASTKWNCILLVASALSFLALLAVTNMLGLHISFFYNHQLRWSSNNNPFLMLMVLASFNLARKWSFENKMINYLSSLSLPVYLIHENIILRHLYRPYLINYVYVHFGYQYVALWMLILAMLILVSSFLCAFVYDKTLKRLICRLTEWIYVHLVKAYCWLEKVIMRIR